MRLWFSVFPVAEWSYYLLAMLMPAIALWIVWRLSADYLDIEKRVFGIALLTLVPFFNFHALKFNVNTVLMPLWAATTLWFLRSYMTRSTLYAALAGAGAAAGMMGKYWSIFLIAGLVVAALIDKRRNAYFRSAAPWITVLVGVVVLAPHWSGFISTISRRSATRMVVHGSKSFAAAAYQRARLFRRLGRLCRDPGDRGAGRGAAGPRADRRHDVAGRHRPPAGGGGILGTLAASRGRRARQRHRHHLAVVDVGLDAFARPALSLPAMTISGVDTRRLLAIAVALPLVMPISSPAILQFPPRR